MTLSDLIVGYLEQFGVEYVFSVPGSPLGPLYDALARSEKRGGPRSVLARHETGGAFMADGYARETGTIGVCCSTTGPGATNLITGVASAHSDHVPLLAITAQTRLSRFGQGPFQDSSADGTDIVSMFGQCTRYNSLVTHPDQLEKKLAAAITIALQPPRGPAHLSIPVDILNAPVSGNGGVGFPDLRSLVTAPASIVDYSALERLCMELHGVLGRDQKVALLIGHDCAGATDDIVRFAELINASIVTTQRGKSRIDPYHPLARGVFGFAGHETARMALTDESVGLILAAGTELGEWSTSGWDPVLLNNRLVHIHSDMACFARSPMARLHVYGTIGTIFSELYSRLEAIKQGGRLSNDATDVPMSPEAQSNTAHQEPSPYVPVNIKVQAPESCRRGNARQTVKPQRVFMELAERLPPETRFIIDNSNSVPWSIHYFFSRHPGNYHLPIGFASMGWAIGASIGMAMAARNTPVVCFTGDGCFLMSGQEITVAVQERLPVIFVVLNDRAYGMIRHAHRLTGAESLDFAVPSVDFIEMAKATGADARTIRHPDDFGKLDYQAMCRRKGPTLLEVYIDPEEAPPIGMF